MDPLFLDLGTSWRLSGQLHAPVVLNPEEGLFGTH
jgi:hypothetical protein